MSDQPEAAPPPELTPEQERAVSRLVAEARHDGGVPDDVVARLDEALAELSHADLEGVAEPDEAAVVDLVAHRRRRRNAGRLLLAAAAVIIIGVGVGQVISNSDSSDDSSAATDRAIDRSDSGSGSATAPLDAAPSAAIAPIELTGEDPTSLAAQLSSQLAAASFTVPADPAPSPARQQRLLDRAAPEFTCAQPAAGAYGAGELLPAYFNGQAVVLALRPSAQGTSQGTSEGTTEADVLECGTGTVVTTFTATLP